MGSTMSWHGFKRGQAIGLADVVSACRRRIETGGVIDEEEKAARVDEIEACGHTTIVFDPQADTIRRPDSQDGGAGRRAERVRDRRLERHGVPLPLGLRLGDPLHHRGRDRLTEPHLYPVAGLGPPGQVGRADLPHPGGEREFQEGRRRVRGPRHRPAPDRVP